MALSNGSMLAVVWNGTPYNMSVESRPIPTIVNQTDAIVRMSSAAICGSDLHVYHGVYGSAEPGWVMGHEGVGYIESLGDSVYQHAVGDYVVIPDNFGNGLYPDLKPAAGMTPGYGPDYTEDQDVGGCQAEYVRVPFADFTLYSIPKTNGTWNTSKELDYVMTSDVFATAWEGLTWAGFEAGDTVAVFGAGPVGQMAAYAAIIRGASRVYAIDRIQQRLDLAESIGAIPIDYRNGDAVAQIMAREPGGVARSIDAVGFEARSANGTIEENIVLNQTLQVTQINGGIGVLGIYSAQNNAPGRPRSESLSAELAFNTTAAFNKNILWRAGAVDARMLAPQLLQLINTGATPGYIVSAEINITEAPVYYRKFSDWEESKVVIRF